MEVATVRDQTPNQDMLEDRGDGDWLNEGYSPPERMPATHSVTAAEQREGETLDDRLAQEEPEAGLASGRVPDEQWEDEGTGRERAGRLVAPDEGAHEDTEKDLVAGDVGIDGGAASAEEAAVHVVPEDQLP
jgi:hypothetical protein